MDPRVVAERFRFDLGYDADISGRDLLAGRARQAGRLAKLWASHPGELTKAVEAWTWRLRGTHDRPQDDGATLTDRVQRLEQDGRARWQASAVRRRVEDGKKDARRAKWRLQRRLNESLPPTPRLVAGDLDAVLGSDRLVVLAEYSLGGRLRPEALSGAAAWAAAGVPTLVVAARDAWSSKTLHVDPLPDGVAVVRRPNVGYDFGSWGAALTAYPEIAAKSPGRADQRLARRSLRSARRPARPDRGVPGRRVGGDRERATRRSICRATCSAFRGGVLAREPLRGFFAGVRAQETKRDVIQTYEFGLSELVQSHGMKTEVGWPKAALGISSSVDSVLGAWPRMLAGGFPFVKRTLLEDSRFADQRDAIAVVVQQEYGVEPR